MQRMGLSPADLLTYTAGLKKSHERRIVLSVLDMDGHLLKQATIDDADRITDGQVSVDAHASVTRTLSLTFIDAAHAMNFDPFSPAASGMHFNTQLRVTSSRNIDSLGWVDCDVFTGPLRSFQRQGESVSLTANGRDTLGSGALWTPFNRKKGTLKTDVIRALLERYGESHFDFPSLSSRLPHAVAMGRQHKPWPRAKHIADSMTRQLFYNGHGVAVLRQKPGQSLIRFDDYLLSKASPNRDLTNFANAVRVTGGKPKGHKKAVSATAVLSPSHPLSPSSLAGSGGHVYLVKDVSNPHLRSHGEAQKKADDELKDASRALVNMTFDAVPMDHLEEYDLATVEGTEFRMRTFTIPLTPDGNPGAVMSVGLLKRTTKA